MGLLLLLLVLPVCVVVALRRSRIGRWLAVPAALAAYVIIDVAWFALTVMRAIDSVSSNGSMKATMLAKGISVLMNATAFALLVHVPLLVAAYVVNRWIHRTPSTPRS